MERVVPGARQRADLVGSAAYWGTFAATLGFAVPFVIWPSMRVWIGCAVLLMWSTFFTVNAIRSRRVHSIISAPVYLLAAAVLAGTALNRIQPQVWMVWLLGAGILAANLSERFFRKYLL